MTSPKERRDALEAKYTESLSRLTLRIAELERASKGAHEAWTSDTGLAEAMNVLEHVIAFGETGRAVPSVCDNQEKSHEDEGGTTGDSGLSSAGEAMAGIVTASRAGGQSVSPGEAHSGDRSGRREHRGPDSVRPSAGSDDHVTAPRASKVTPAGCGCVCSDCIRRKSTTHLVCAYKCALFSRETICEPRPSEVKAACRNCGGDLNYPGEGLCMSCWTSHMSRAGSTETKPMRRWCNDPSCLSFDCSTCIEINAMARVAARVVAIESAAGFVVRRYETQDDASPMSPGLRERLEALRAVLHGGEQRTDKVTAAADPVETDCPCCAAWIASRDAWRDRARSAEAGMHLAAVSAEALLAQRVTAVPVASLEAMARSWAQEALEDEGPNEDGSPETDRFNDALRTIEERITSLKAGMKDSNVAMLSERVAELEALGRELRSAKAEGERSPERDEIADFLSRRGLHGEANAVRWWRGLGAYDIAGQRTDSAKAAVESKP